MLALNKIVAFVATTKPAEHVPSTKKNWA